MPSAAKQSLLMWLLVVLTCGCWLTADAQAQVTITRTSSPIFYLDSGSAQLLGMYTSYKITNTGSTAIPDVWVGIGSFMGGVVSLAPNEDGVMHLGGLAAGQTKAAFFYLQASGTTTTAQTHTISVYPTRPPATTLATANFTFTSVEDTIAAQANKVTATVVGPIPNTSLGGIATISVTGETGSIGGAGILAFTAASYLGWRADAYEMIASNLTLPNGTVLTDTLYTSGYAGTTGVYTMVYTLRAVGTTLTPAAISPVGYISSGNPIKHTTTSNFPSLLPIQPASVTFTLSKSASATSVAGGSVVTYTLRLTNSGTVEVSADAIVDTLPTSPAAPTYRTNTSTFNGGTLGDPTISGAMLTWTATFTVPAGSYRDLTFQVTMPNNAGTYTNNAIAQIGNTQIDTTLSVSDNAPATANVTVVPPDLTIAKSHSGGFIQGQSGATYTITATNAGLTATSGTITVTDTLPTGLTPTAASGTGWSCAISGQTVTCTRTNSLAGNSSYPEIMLTVNVAVNAAASLTNTAAVSGGGETNTSNNTADDVTVIAPPPQGFKSLKLTTDADNTGTVTGGDTVIWTIWYKNVGSVDITSFQLTDSLPAGVTITSPGAQTITVTGTTTALKNSSYTGATSGAAAELLASAVTFKAGDLLRVDIPVVVSTSVTGLISNQVTGAGANLPTAGIQTDNVDSSTTGLPSGIVVPSGSIAQTQNSTIDATTVLIVATPNVTLIKTVVPTGEQLAGTELTYIITFSNIGTAAAQQLVITDAIPTHTDFKLNSPLMNPGTTGLTASVEYSNNYSASSPATATWTYTPVSGGGGAATDYDRNVLALRWRIVAGALSPVAPNNTGEVRFTVKIR